jgi:GTP cyclohydrolase I
MGYLPSTNLTPYERETSQEAARTLLMQYPAFFKLDEEAVANTPRRFAEMLAQMTTREPFKFTTFDAPSDEMVTVGPIPFYTLCAHHLAPFSGHVWIGYVPQHHIAGLSKFARAVKYIAKGFHVQESFTGELTDFLEQKLAPQGVAVYVKAEHLCMAMRGVEVANVITTTSKMTGVFADHSRTAKAEFFEAIR